MALHGLDTFSMSTINRQRSSTHCIPSSVTSNYGTKSRLEWDHFSIFILFYNESPCICIAHSWSTLALTRLVNRLSSFLSNYMFLPSYGPEWGGWFAFDWSSLLIVVSFCCQIRIISLVRVYDVDYHRSVKGLCQLTVMLVVPSSYHYLNQGKKLLVFHHSVKRWWMHMLHTGSWFRQ